MKDVIVCVVVFVTEGLSLSSCFANDIRLSEKKIYEIDFPSMISFVHHVDTTPMAFWRVVLEDSF